MTEQEKLEYRQAMQIVENRTMDYKTYDPAFGMDGQGEQSAQTALGYDPNFAQYDPYDSQGVLNVMGKSNQGHGIVIEPGLITYGFRIIYTDVSGTGTPVEVTLYQKDFNEGTIVGNDLVFTNAVGDIATIIGRTAPYRANLNRSTTQPFRIKYARLNVVDAVQFSIDWRFENNSVYGGFARNALSPDEFLTPEQFQLLRVDLPLRVKQDSERGIKFDVGATEVAPAGMRITLYIEQIDNPTRQLDSKPSVVNLGAPGGLIPNQASIANVAYNLQQMKRTQAVMKAMEEGK